MCMSGHMDRRVGGEGCGTHGMVSRYAGVDLQDTGQGEQVCRGGVQDKREHRGAAVQCCAGPRSARSGLQGEACLTVRRVVPQVLRHLLADRHKARVVVGVALGLGLGLGSDIARLLLLLLLLLCPVVLLMLPMLHPRRLLRLLPCGAAAV